MLICPDVRLSIKSVGNLVVIRFEVLAKPNGELQQEPTLNYYTT